MLIRLGKPTAESLKKPVRTSVLCGLVGTSFVKQEEDGGGKMVMIVTSPGSLTDFWQETLKT